MEITSKHKEEFRKKGWTLVNMGIPTGDIDLYKNALIKLREKALNENFPLKRCYYSHITNDNIAAIESPFNKKIINNEIKDLFRSIKLGEAIKDLMEWDNVYLQLARLFTMRKYNYLGNWHYDFKDWDGDLFNMKTVQVAIYLKDQPGFRIIKPNYDLSSTSNYAISEININPHLPLKLPKEYYVEIKGKAGSALFFAPGILHQGNSTQERLDFHFRFSNKSGRRNDFVYIDKSKSFFDFNIPDFYHENFDVNNDIYNPRDKNNSIRLKIKNSLNYYTGFLNFLIHLKHLVIQKNRIKKPWKVDLFGNTIFQK